MPFLHFRIHRLDIWEPIRDFLIREGTHILSVYESDAGRPHIHSVFQFPKTKSTFGQRLKKKFPNLEGNKDFSISEVKDTPEDLQNILQYICKADSKTDTPDVRFVSPNFNEDNKAEIFRLHNEYWRVNSELKESNVQEVTTKQKAPRAKTFTELVLLEVKRECPNHKWDMNEISMSLVFDVVMKKLGEKVKTFDRQVLRKIVFGVLNVLCPSQSRNYHFKKSFGHEDFYA